ncbi:DNA internalization-related competence protein ComEC/Rec2 [Fibrobacterota bacterium]
MKNLLISMYYLRQDYSGNRAEKTIPHEVPILTNIRAAYRFLADFRQDCRAKVKWHYAIILLFPCLFGCVFHFYNRWAAVLGFTFCLFFFIGLHKTRILNLSLVFCLWCVLLHVFHEKTAIPGQLNQITGRARNFSSGAYMKKIILKTDYGTGIVQSKTMPERIFPGQGVKVYGRFQPLEPPTNPGQFDYAKYLASQDISWLYQADSMTVTSRANFLFRAVAKVRLFLERALEKSISPEALPLVQAALLGTRDLLPNEIRENFANSGMFHLLAISGLHVGIIALVLIQLLTFLRLPRKWAYGTAALLLVLYIPVSGASISVIRSVIMFGCLVITVFLERPRFTLSNLALTCTLCLLIMPYQILSLGFQLSFCATYFLLYYSKTISAILNGYGLRNSFMRAVMSTILVSGLLFFATLPFLAYTIHQVSPLAIFGNILTIFLTSGMVLTGSLSIALSPLFNAPALWMGETCSLFANLLLVSVEKLSRIPLSRLFLPSLSWLLAGLIGSLLLIIPFALSRRKLKPIALSYLLCFSLIYAFSSLANVISEPARITFLDVGQGDAAFISLPGDYHVLLDAGPGSAQSGSGRYTILPFLKYSGINELDLVILSHGDLDHYGGLRFLIPRIDIKKVAYSGDSSSAQAWAQTVQMLINHDIPLIIIHCRDTLYKHPHVSLSVLSPCRENQFSTRNDNSVVVSLTMHGKRILLTGDIEKRAEQWLAGIPGTQSDIVKISHHGSATASTAEFLKAVSPGAGIISAGRNNRFGMPHTAALERLANQGVEIYSTISHGAVSFNSNRFRSSWEFMVPDR